MDRVYLGTLDDRPSWAQSQVTPVQVLKCEGRLFQVILGPAFHVTSIQSSDILLLKYFLKRSSISLDIEKQR